jgi:hypothetical protein
VSVGCLLSELSGTDEVTLVGTESHSESCTTHGVCKAIVEVAKDGYSANPSPIAAHFLRGDRQTSERQEQER